VKRRDFIRSGFLAGLAAAISRPTRPAGRPAPPEPDIHQTGAGAGDVAVVSVHAGAFIAVGVAGETLQSKDGVTWTERGK